MEFPKFSQSYSSSSSWMKCGRHIWRHLIGTPLKVAGIHGMYGMYGCFISVGVSILGEDVIISFLVKHLDFSSLPSCLARSSKSVLENHPFFVYTPGVYTCSHPFSNSHDWLDKSPMFKSENTPSNVCFSIVILVVCGELEEVVWIPHHFSATKVTLLLGQH